MNLCNKENIKQRDFLTELEIFWNKNSKLSYNELYSADKLIMQENNFKKASIISSKETKLINSEYNKNKGKENELVKFNQVSNILIGKENVKESIIGIDSYRDQNILSNRPLINSKIDKNDELFQENNENMGDNNANFNKNIEYDNQNKTKNELFNKNKENNNNNIIENKQNKNNLIIINDFNNNVKTHDKLTERLKLILQKRKNEILQSKNKLIIGKIDKNKGKYGPFLITKEINQINIEEGSFYKENNCSINFEINKIQEKCNLDERNKSDAILKILKTKKNNQKLFKIKQKTNNIKNIKNKDPKKQENQDSNINPVDELKRLFLDYKFIQDSEKPNKREKSSKIIKKQQISPEILSLMVPITNKNNESNENSENKENLIENSEKNNENKNFKEQNEKAENININNNNEIIKNSINNNENFIEENINSKNKKNDENNNNEKNKNKIKNSNNKIEIKENNNENIEESPTIKKSILSPISSKPNPSSFRNRKFKPSKSEKKPPQPPKSALILLKTPINDKKYQKNITQSAKIPLKTEKNHENTTKQPLTDNFLTPESARINKITKNANGLSIKTGKFNKNRNSILSQLAKEKKKSGESFSFTNLEEKDFLQDKISYEKETFFLFGNSPYLEYLPDFLPNDQELNEDSEINNEKLKNIEKEQREKMKLKFNEISASYSKNK